MPVAVDPCANQPRPPTRAGWGIARFGLKMLRNPGSGRSSAFLGLADMVLGVELETEAGDQLELGFEVVNVLFLVLHQLFKQVPGHIVLGGVTMSRRPLVEGAGEKLSREVAVQHLLDGLTD